MFQYGVVLPFLLRILIRMRRTRTTLLPNYNWENALTPRDSPYA